jgi:cardiolipin synthase
VSEDRRPQSTFAWLFLLVPLPVAGFVIYVPFRRMRVDVGRARTLERQDRPWEQKIADTVRAEHDAALSALAERQPPRDRLARPVRSGADMRATTSNHVELLFDAAEK